MEFVFLGTSGAMPTVKRGLPAVILEYLNEFFLFDCGEGTLRQMRKADINFMRINNVFITHLHADHFAGLCGLIQSMDFMDRTRELNIYGPVGMKKTMDHLLAMGSFMLDSFRVNVHEVSVGLVMEGDNYTVTCARTIHTRGSVAYCFEEKAKRTFLKEKALSLGIPEGRLFSKLQRGQEIGVLGKKFTPEDVLSEPSPGRKFVYTGDTKPSGRLADFFRNADVLIHDCTYSKDEADLVEGSAHSTTVQAAEAAKSADVMALYLTHLSQRYQDPKRLEEEAREVFKNSFVAEDFLRVKVAKHKTQD